MAFLQHRLSGSSMWNWSRDLQKAEYASNHHLIYGTLSPIARFHGSRNQKVDKGIVPLTTISRDSLGKFLFLPVPETLSFSGLEVLIPEKAAIFLPEVITNIPINWKFRFLSGRFGLLIPLNQQYKKGIMML